MSIDISQVGAEVNVNSNELILAQLIDEDTRMRSNVRGRGKEKLDPTIIEYENYRIVNKLMFFTFAP